MAITITIRCFALRSFDQLSSNYSNSNVCACTCRDVDLTSATKKVFQKTADAINIVDFVSSSLPGVSQLGYGYIWH